MNRKIKKIFIKNWRTFLVSALCLFFFLGTAGYNYYAHQNGISWSSPDEKANYIFTKLYGQTGELTIFEKYNLLAKDIIHPRSFKSEGGYIKPISFLGIILFYGTIVKFSSYKIIPYLTPFFASLALFYFYLLIKKIFGKNNALISVFLLASFPPFIYYTARGMFHNVIFVAMLVIGLYYAVLMVKKKTFSPKEQYKYFFYSALSGFFIGMAIIIRTSELLWLAPVLFILWLFNIKKIKFSNLLIFLSFAGLAVLPVLYWNQILYNSPAKGGYPEMNQAISNIFVAISEILKSIMAGCFSCIKDLLYQVEESIFHFGFRPQHSLKMLFYYFAVMFPWLFIGAMLGGLMIIKKYGKKKKIWSFFIFLAISSVILIFYYGSWEFHDNPDPNSFTIGNSYTRYWLPVYMGAIPLFSYFIMRITRILFKKSKENFSVNLEQRKKSNFYKLFIFNKITINPKFLPTRKFLIISSRILIVGIIIIYSLNFLLFGSEEGLFFTLQRQRNAYQEIEKVLELTENNSVIITKYHDKILFPDRKVIVNSFESNEINAIYAGLLKYLPVYYFNFTFPQKDMDYLNNKKLKEVGMKIEEVEKINFAFSLYRLSLVP